MYCVYGNISWYINGGPLFGGGPLFAGSVIGGSTVAPHNTTDSNAPACALFASQTSLPYSKVGLTTARNSNIYVHSLMSLLLITLCNWLTFFLPLATTFFICTSRTLLSAKSIPKYVYFQGRHSLLNCATAELQNIFSKIHFLHH